MEKKISQKSEKFLIAIIPILGGVWFFFYYLYPYKADFYSKTLYLGMSREKAEEIIPVEIYSRHGYPHPMSREPKSEYGWRVSWKFSDGSILEADFNELSGLKSFAIDKSDTYGVKMLDAVMSIVYLFWVVVFIDLIGNKLFGNGNSKPIIVRMFSRGGRYRVDEKNDKVA